MTILVEPANSLKEHSLQALMDFNFGVNTYKLMLSKSLFQPHLSWSNWAPSFSYLVGAIVKPTSPNAHAYEAQTSGTSGSSEPAFPTDGSAVNDNGIVWQDLGVNPPLQEVNDGTNQIGCIDTAVEWAPTTVKIVGDFVFPLTRNGFLYRCTVAGTTGGTEPVFPTVVGFTVVDGTVTWRNVGRNPAADETDGTGGYTTGGITLASVDVLRFNRRTRIDAADVSIPASTITARWGTVFQVGTFGTVLNPFVAFVLLDSLLQDVVTTGDTFAVAWAPGAIILVI